MLNKSTSFLIVYVEASRKSCKTPYFCGEVNTAVNF